MTKNILNFYASVETIINGLVSLVVNVFMFAITTLAPLAAPIAPAFSVYKALAERLDAPFSIALAGAIAIEITGMFVSKTAIRAHNWNVRKNKTDPEAPKALAIAMTAIFFIVILILAFTIEINPALSVYVYPGFVVVAITVYVCLAVSNDLAKWETDKANDLAQRAERNGLAADIRRAKQEANDLAQMVQDLTAEGAKLAQDIDRQKAEMNRLQMTNDTKNPPNDTTIMDRLPQANEARRLKKQERLNRIIELAADHTQPEMAEILGVSVSTIKRDMKSLNGQLEGVHGADNETS